jgi:hypothetical protein
MVSSKQDLIVKMSQGTNQFDILGFIVFWNVRNVRIDRATLEAKLTEQGLDKKYARSHNYRSAFIRALRNLEEKWIIRLVEENHSSIMYQFTAESKVEDATGDDARLAYDPETLIKVNKDAYRETEQIDDAISGRSDIVQKVVQCFNQERDSYQSSDITRMIQRIFNDHADIITMRPQGGVYFVPSPFQNVIQSLTQLLAGLGGDSTMESLPVPDVESSRVAVKNAVLDDVESIIKQLNEEVDNAFNSDGVTAKWAGHRLDQIRRMQQRINQYEQILDKGAAGKLADKFARMEQTIRKTRVLEL